MKNPSFVLKLVCKDLQVLYENGLQRSQNIIRPSVQWFVVSSMCSAGGQDNTELHSQRDAFFILYLSSI